MADSLATFNLRQDAKPGGLCDPDTQINGDDVIAALRALRGPQLAALGNAVADALDRLAEGCDSLESMIAWDRVVEAMQS
ncbi:MAG: hypothetical protein ACEQSH_00640 [Bacteroidia bacterium]